MRINMKILVAVGGFLFVAAAFLCISLMASFFGAQHAIPEFLRIPGVILSGAYGYSSWLTVFFLLASGILVMLPNWNDRRGVYLLVSVLPFFTLVLTEKLCVSIVTGVNVPYLGLKLSAVLVASGLLVAIEYLVAGFLCDLFFDNDESPNEKVVPPISEAIPSSAFFEPLDQNSTESELESEKVQVQVQEPDITKTEPAYKFEDLDLIATTPLLEAESSVQTEGFSDIFGITDEEAAYILGTPFVEEEFAEQPVAETSVSITEEIQPPVSEQKQETEVEKLEEVILDEEINSSVLFVDLNWKENKTSPVCVRDDTEAMDEERLAGFETDFEAEVEDEAELMGEPFAEPAVDFDEPVEFGDMPDELDEQEEPESNYQATYPIPTFSKNPFVAQDLLPLKRGSYRVPADGLLNTYPDGEYWIIDSETQRAASILKETLSEFKISAEVTGIRKGPVITMFEILPAPGVKLTRIVALQDNIALRLAASSVRIVAPIPGKHAVGIEVPNKDRFIVSFRELIDNDAPGYKKMEIPVVLGKDITGEAQILDLTSTPHLLIAGSTGSGKSVCVNSMILSILYKRSAQEVKMILIDPKIVELKLYNDIPHLLTPVITEPKKAFQALQYCLCEMERRYSLLDKMGVRDIKSFNRRITERNLANEKLPYIVVIIDEFADLMATTGKELESTVARLAAMSRAVGVHLVLATQRPSIDVITGLIKANIPTRIAFMVASKMDSRIIIDQVGAEKLLGRGDMLYSSAVDPFPVRIQGTYVSEEEVERVVEYVKQYGEPEYIDDEIFFDDEEEPAEPSLFGGEDDPLYDKALEIVLQAGKASASYIQRRLKIGYNRAARLVENMEQRGIVGPANGSKPREVVHVPK